MPRDQLSQKLKLMIRPKDWFYILSQAYLRQKHKILNSPSQAPEFEVETELGFSIFQRFLTPIQSQVLE